MREKLTYANVMATLAVFLALTGGTAAVALSGRNTVDPGDIIRGNVKTSDLGNAAVTNPKLAGDAVTGEKVANESLGGADVGGLTGSDLGENSLGSREIAGLGGGDLSDDSLTGQNIVESTLGQVPSAASATNADNAANANNAANAANAGLLDSRDSTAFVGANPAGLQKPSLFYGEGGISAGGSGSVYAVGPGGSPVGFVRVDSCGDPAVNSSVVFRTSSGNSATVIVFDSSSGASGNSLGPDSNSPPITSGLFDYGNIFVLFGNTRIQLEIYVTNGLGGAAECRVRVIETELTP